MKADLEMKKKAKKKITRSSRKGTPKSVKKTSFPIVGIGASAGGLEAYMELFRRLPSDTGMAFVLVQHLSPKNLSMLSEIVQKTTTMPVQEVEDGMVVRPNHVYVIPPNSVLEIFHGVLHRRPMNAEFGTNRLVDIFFNSLARDHKHLAVGIVLSGTGSDGSQGLLDIKAAGGISLVQDPASAKYDGMPTMAIKLDHPDRITPVSGLAKELIRIALNPHLRQAFAFEQGKLKPEAEASLRKIFILIRAATGTDFSVYKYPTILRRIRRRMLLSRIDTLANYHTYLVNSPAEVQALFADLIINVTRFFRDSEVFEVLKTQVLPAITHERSEGEPIRIWVPGCSTGEEVYTIAICVLEFLEEQALHFPVQIYGTDVSESIIKKARAGFYNDGIKSQISKERIEQFFVQENNGFRIVRKVRDCCIFSLQDITVDPPIHRLDLLSCRNLMIYLGNAVQKKLMETFFYALNDRGFLLLGTSESVGASATLFRVVDEKSKIYLKRTSSVFPRRTVYSSRMIAEKNQPALGIDLETEDTKTSKYSHPLRMAEKIVQQRFTPAWILVNQSNDIIQFKGNTDNLIAPRSGEPSWNMARMLREELVADVSILIQATQHDRKTVRKEGIQIKSDDVVRRIDVEVVPVTVAENDPHYLVLFFERIEKDKNEKGLTGSKDPAMRKLKEELAFTKRSLRSFLEEQTSTRQELQSANEEVMSANEELQSTNEELETAKEELQSTNEELVTLNEELSQRNSELHRTNDDLSNILTNVHVAIIIVAEDLTIRKLTPAATKLFNFSENDIGRSLADFNTGFPIEKLRKKLLEVIHDVTPQELEVDVQGRHFSVLMRPYKTMDKRIDGAVLTLLDVDQLKHKEQVALASQEYSNAIIQTIHDPLLILNQQLVVERANKSYFDTFRVSLQDAVGKPFFKISNKQWDLPELKELLENILPQKTEIRDFLVDRKFAHIGRRRMLINARRLEWNHHHEVMILLAIRDVTENQHMIAARE